MEIEEFGQIIVMERNGQPYIEINNFVTRDTTGDELKEFAIQYAIHALQKEKSCLTP